jgi:hypothetical protein
MVTAKDIKDIKNCTQELKEDEKLSIGNVIVDYSNLRFVREHFYKIEYVLTQTAKEIKGLNDKIHKGEFSIDYDKPIDKSINRAGNISKIEKYEVFGTFDEAKNDICYFTLHENVRVREKQNINEDYSDGYSK